MFREAISDICEQQKQREVGLMHQVKLVQTCETRILTDIRWPQTSQELEGLYQRVLTQLPPLKHHSHPDLQHANELSAIIPFLEALLMRRMDATLDKYHAKTLAINLITYSVTKNALLICWDLFRTEHKSNGYYLEMKSAASNRWVDTLLLRERSFHLLYITQSIILLSATASEVAHTFETSIHQAQILNRTQYKASLSATELTATLADLTTMTHVELEKISNTSEALIRRARFHMESGPFDVFWPVMRALRALFQGNWFLISAFVLARWTVTNSWLGILRPSDELSRPFHNSGWYRYPCAKCFFCHRGALICHGRGYSPTWHWSCARFSQTTCFLLFSLRRYLSTGLSLPVP